MKTTQTRLRTPTDPGRIASFLALLALLALAGLASCGGGGGVGSGGTGRSDVGFAAGTVNGFGSVIVDGVAYDDRTATVVVETAPGHDQLADVKLGQRVSVEYATPGVARVVRVDPAVSGPVATIVADGFTVLGQSVVLNSIGTAGPITQFGGGYARGADVRAGDPVDVHGILVPKGGSYVIQATRVDKLASLPAYLRATGLVASLSAATRSFSLALLTVDAALAPVVPAGTTLVVGQTVSVLAPSASLTGGAGPRIQAAEVRVRTLSPAVLATYLSGKVSLLDATARTFVLDGHVVNYGTATVSPAASMLANGLYVQAVGTTTGNGSLAATSVTIRDAGSDSEAELHGNISAYAAATSTFTVRGVPVDVSAASLSGCPVTGLANGLFVEVHGATVSSGVRARTVACESESAGSTVEREGKASAVDVVGRSFTLTPQAGAAIRVSWGDTTFFGSGLAPATLSGKTVHVEGSIVAGGLVATKIQLED